MNSMKTILSLLLIVACEVVSAQSPTKIEFNQQYNDVTIAERAVTYALSLKKGGLYKITVMQKGIDVVITLKDQAGKTLSEKDSPNGQNGPEEIEYTPTLQVNGTLIIKRLDEDGNSASGKVDIYVKKYSDAEIVRKEAI